MNDEETIRAHIKEREAWRLYQNSVEEAKIARKSASEAWEESREKWLDYQDKYNQFKGLSTLASKAGQVVAYYRDDWADSLVAVKGKSDKV